MNSNLAVKVERATEQSEILYPKTIEMSTYLIEQFLFQIASPWEKNQEQNSAWKVKTVCIKYEAELHSNFKAHKTMNSNLAVQLGRATEQSEILYNFNTHQDGGQMPWPSNYVYKEREVERLMELDPIRREDD